MNDRKFLLSTGVIIPALQSLILGSFLGFASVGASLLVGYTGNLLALAITVSGIAAIFSWLYFVGIWLDCYVLPPKESTENIPDPTTSVNVYSDEGRSGQFIDLPIDQDRMIEISVGLTEGKSFSHASLAGQGKPLSRSEFENLRDEFIRRGLASWINPHSRNQGIELTGSGRAIVRRFASMAEGAPPTLLKRR